MLSLIYNLSDRQSLVSGKIRSVRGRRLLFHLSFAGAVIAGSSCSEKPPVDPCCVYTPITELAEVGDDQGLLQIEGSTNASYYILDELGKQVGYESLNRAVGLSAGRYIIRVNNSVHSVIVRAGENAKCSTGTLMVAGNTSDYYYVMDSTDQQLGYEVLGRSMSFFPGKFKIRVNNTEVPAEVKLRELTEIRTGSIIVKGTTNEYYYVVDKSNKQLNYNSLGKPLAFLPGKYDVKLNNTSMEANVRAGNATEFTTGNLLVNGLTDEYYYVTDTAGNALNYQSLNKYLAFFPGTFQIKVNNTLVRGQVSPGDTTRFMTGSIRLTGGGPGYYYVLDEDGRQLNYNSLNKSLSFFPSEYTVKLGSSTRRATVTAGQLTSINAFD
ncbi:MAG: hypothetical protein M3Y60_13510 [Bacteroidota bacterium]|nr:hypothetical protein [Bacteroidota bacterium]